MRTTLKTISAAHFPCNCGGTLKLAAIIPAQDPEHHIFECLECGTLKWEKLPTAVADVTIQ